MSTTGQESINRAARLVHAVDPDETLTATEIDNILDALNAMLDSWVMEGIALYATVKEDFTLTIDQYEYTIGSGGDLDTVRPDRILGGFIRDDGYDYPLRIIDERKYRHLLDKDTSSRPEWLYYHPDNPLANVFLYYAPDEAYGLHIWSKKPLTAVTRSAAYDYPRGYRDAIDYNLAVRIASEFGVPVPPQVYEMARWTKNAIVTNNFANNIKSRPLEVAAFSGRSRSRTHSNILND